MINIFKTNNKKIMRNESYVEKMAHFIVQRGRIIEKFFIAMTILCAVCYPFVGVNYDLSKYLPDLPPPSRRWM